MSTSTVQKSLRKAIPRKKILWETFQKKYLIREDKYKYEWVDGYVEKTIRTMDKTQFFIQKALTDFLYSLKNNWNIIAEGDTFFAGNHRRPDIAFYTNEQILAAKENKPVVPQFVIEIISTNDKMNLVDKKMDNYRAAKVKVIWHIFPKSQKVHVYHGKKMQICETSDVCTAESVIPKFNISVNKIFS